MLPARCFNDIRASLYEFHSNIGEVPRASGSFKMSQGGKSSAAPNRLSAKNLSVTSNLSSSHQCLKESPRRAQATLPQVLQDPSSAPETETERKREGKSKSKRPPCLRNLSCQRHCQEFSEEAPPHSPYEPMNLVPVLSSLSFLRGAEATTLIRSPVSTCQHLPWSTGFSGGCASPLKV